MQNLALKVGDTEISLPAGENLNVNFIFLSGSKEPIPAANDDRRFFVPELNEGEHYAGIILDETNDYHLILLPESVAEIKWQAAMDWAAEQGGELPTRREQSLLFANLKEKFQPRWHWSCEEHPDKAPYAWVQDFSSGGQYYGLKDDESCARAVRRLSVIE